MNSKSKALIKEGIEKRFANSPIVSRMKQKAEGKAMGERMGKGDIPNFLKRK